MSGNRKFWKALLLVLLLVVTTASITPAQEKYVLGEMVIKMQTGQSIDVVNSQFGTTVGQYLPQLDLYMINANTGQDLEILSAQIEALSEVEFCQPNYLVDPLQPVQGSLPVSDQASYGDFVNQDAVGRLQITVAQAFSTGDGVRVGVLDGGINYNHPAFEGQASSAYDYVDDDSDAFDEAGGENSGHGTFVAGVIHLIAPDAEIRAYRVTDTDGESNGYIVAEAMLQAMEDGCRVINLSMVTMAQHEAIARAAAYGQAHDVLTIVAAGNGHSDSAFYPASDVATIGVAAVDTSSALAYFSSYGSHVDVCAPGTEVCAPYLGSTYAWWEGTSFAAPFVSAQAALLISLAPTAPWSEIRASIVGTATNIDDVNVGYEGKLGAGMINILESLSPFVCGDVNAGGVVDITDILFLIDHLFSEWGPDLPAPEAADLDDYIGLNNNDVAALIANIFYLEPLICNPTLQPPFTVSGDLLELRNTIIPAGQTQTSVEIWLNAQSPWRSLGFPFAYSSSIGAVSLDNVEIDSTFLYTGLQFTRVYSTIPGGAFTINSFQQPYGEGWRLIATLDFTADQAYGEDVQVLIDTAQYQPGNSVVFSRNFHYDPVVPTIVGLGGDYDIDGDGIGHFDDNCPLTYNPDQFDIDGDGFGDACDICAGGDDSQDYDEDGVPDACDNCLATANNDQADSDGDGWGDACERCPGYDDSLDVDSDAIPDSCDNCPTVANAPQADVDNDGIGDACDDCVDADGDGIGVDGYPNQTCPTADNCPNTYNPDQSDNDGDGVGNVCDNCVNTYNAQQYNTDGDLYGNSCDNCPTVPNDDQADSDGNGVGDACDGLEDMCGNVNGDYAPRPDISDLAMLVDHLYLSGAPIFEANADMDDFIGINQNDVATLADYFFWSLDELTCTPSQAGGFPASTTDTLEIRGLLIPAQSETWTAEVWLTADEDWSGLALPLLYDCSNTSIVLDSVIRDTGLTGYYNFIPRKVASGLDTSVIIGLQYTSPLSPGTYRVGVFFFSNTYSDKDAILFFDTCTIDPGNTTVLCKSQGDNPVKPVIVGLASESDMDGDGVLDIDDNCPFTPNLEQYDTDSDGLGDACDNCPLQANVDQADADNDGVGDLCDVCPDDPLNDPDLDGICGGVDNCPDVANALQTDTDGDGVGDACDRCEGYDDAIDSDGDLVPDGCDNCAYVSNPDQNDQDGDGKGDLCDLCTHGDDSCSTICTMAGDVNFNYELNYNDLTDLIDYIYLAGPPPPNPLNADCDNHIGIGTRDVMYLEAYIGDLGVTLYCPPVEATLPEIDSNTVLQFRDMVEPYASELAVPLTLVSPNEVLAFNFPLEIRVNDTIVPTIDSFIVSNVFTGLDWEFTPDIVFRTEDSTGTALVSGVTFWGDTPLTPGSNRLGTLYLTVHPSSAERVLSMNWGTIKPEQPLTLEYPNAGLYPVVISPGDLPEADFMFAMADAMAGSNFLPEFGPVLEAGGTCCQPPTVGDVDCSGGIDITDIQVLVDNLFMSLTPLCCDYEGDIDLNSEIDITDLQLLIDNQFISLSPLPACP